MNIIEISNKFPNELSCIEYAEKVRWGKKVKCAYCGSDKSSSVTVNTHLHNTRLPLKNVVLCRIYYN